MPLTRQLAVLSELVQEARGARGIPIPHPLVTDVSLLPQSLFYLVADILTSDNDIRQDV
jgi:hypothetical protein